MMKILVVFATFIVASFAENEIEEFADENQHFAANCLKYLDEGEQKNLIHSPLSMQTLGGMLYAGAESQIALLSEYFLLPYDTEGVFILFKKMLPRLISNSQNDLNIANRIYFQNNMSLIETFEKSVVDVFNAGLESVDFSKNAEIAKQINEWVEKETNEKIKDFIEPNALEGYIKLVAVNTIYFNGEWLLKFEKQWKGKFYQTESNIIDVDMVNVIEKFGYYASEDLKAEFLELFYEDKEMSMVIVLPNEKVGLSGLKDRFEEIFDEKPYESTLVNVTMLKFKIQSVVHLITLCEEIGMTYPCNEKLLTFSSISPDVILKLKSPLRRAYNTIYENGTKAAAATYVSKQATPNMPPTPLTFTVNRPFVFYIKKRIENADVVLFVGKVREPRALFNIKT